MCCYCVCCTGEVKLHEEATNQFKAAGSVTGLTMAAGDVLVACGTRSIYPTSWATVYDMAGQQKAELHIPHGCTPFDVVELGSHLLLTDLGNKCLQVLQPLQHAATLYNNHSK